MTTDVADLSSFTEFNNHKLVVFGSDKDSGLRAFIAIHNTNLGPAVGGTRFWSYATNTEALQDALRLSRAMTYKCALAGVPFGGGKGVIIAPRNYTYSPKLFTAYANTINLLSGNFFTGEDVGMGKSELSLLEKKSKSIIGREKIAGNPSPWAALGVFHAMLAGLRTLYGSDDVMGRSFAIKGVGKVGGVLCEYLYKRGAKIYIADIDRMRLREVAKRFPQVKVVSPKEIHNQKVSVYMPCALGGEFSRKNIKQLRCELVCGAANNQLTTREEGIFLHTKGILYIPDYLANAGGLINVVAELGKNGYNRKEVESKVKKIGQTAERIIHLSVQSKKPTSEVADRLAESIFMKKR